MGKIYLIYGEDEFLKQKKIKEIQGQSNVEDSINSILLTGPTWEEVYDEITLPAFLTPNKMITIFELDIFKENIKKEKNEDPNLPSPQTFFENLIEDEKYRNEILDGLNIVIIMDSKKISKTNKIYKMFEKESNKTKGINFIEVLECNKMLDLEVQKYLSSRAKELKLNLDNATIKYLIDIVDKNTYTQFNEFMKLCFLNKAINGEKITKEDVDQTCIKNEEAVIYTITDHIINGKKEEAVKLADIFLESGQGLILLGYIYKYFRNIYISNLAINEKNEKSLHIILDLKSNQKFLVQKYLTVAKKMGTKKLKFILKELGEIDEAFKLGDENASYLLKNLIKLI